MPSGCCLLRIGERAALSSIYAAVARFAGYPANVAGVLKQDWFFQETRNFVQKLLAV
jgi:hypothetical protein